MSKPTPGPWKRDEYGDITNPAGHRVNFRGVSTLMSSIEERMAEAEANTALLIAAPDLLEALKAARPVVNAMIQAFGRVWVGTSGQQQDFGQRLALIDAAIAKAEGEA